MSESYSIILGAIKNHKNIYCIYHGLERYITPHFLGHFAKNPNEEAFNGFQFDGSRGKGAMPGWDTFKVCDMHDVMCIDGAMHSKKIMRPERTPNGIDVEIELVLSKTESVIYH